MSFTQRKHKMEEGDTVLLYLGYDNIVPLQLARGRVYQTRYGALKHEQLIGTLYGMKVNCSRGWVYPLQPTAELWTLALPHRTQILYSPDISLIIMELHLKPGAVIVEAGTGSGSLSHALIRSIMPTGHLHTFEFHAERCAAACAEFKQHGLGDYVTARHRDVCSQGFDLHHMADAVFLDLPAPWECVISAKQALRQGGRICTFSPCMEQVQRTCEELHRQGFDEVTTVECVSRTFSVQAVRLAPVDFGDMSSEGQSVHSAGCKVAKTEGPECGDVVEHSRTDTEQQHTVNLTVEGKAVNEGIQMKVHSLPTAQKVTNPSSLQSQGKEFMTAAPSVVMQGHTGFLTFASLY